MTPTDARYVVEAMVNIGARFDRVEEYIDALPLDGEHRDALWLLAWAQATNPATRARTDADTASLRRP
jgi:hypothetical protein